MCAKARIHEVKTRIRGPWTTYSNTAKQNMIKAKSNRLTVFVSFLMH